MTTRLIILVETVPVDQDGPDHRLIDPHTIAEQIVEEYNEGCLAEGEPATQVKFLGAEWNATPEFVRPKDHEARIAVVESYAQWHLGAPSWAARLFTAYEHHEQVRKDLLEEMGD